MHNINNMPTREEKRQIIKNVMESAKALVNDYCVLSGGSEPNFLGMRNLNKKKLKKAVSLIEKFADNLLVMAEMDTDNFDFQFFCPKEEPMSFCHMEKEEEVSGINGRKRKYTTGLKCETPFHFKGDDQWPKRFIPQMYHILQDYGLFFVYLDIPPKYRSNSNLSHIITAVITEKRMGIIQETPMDTHLSRVEFLDKLQVRLQKVKFLRDLYINCCSTNTSAEASSGKDGFNEVLLNFSNSIETNMGIEQDALERITNPSSSEPEEDSDSDSDE